MTTRRDRVLAMLKEAGNKGVHTEVLARNGGGRNVSQRRRELIERGYRIESVPESWTGAHGERCHGARFTLISEPRDPAFGGHTPDPLPPEAAPQPVAVEPEAEALFEVPAYADPDTYGEAA